MKAVRFHEKGGVGVLRYEEAPDPKPGPGEVLLRVRAASVNHVDLLMRTIYTGASLPHIPGSDAAGEVAALGEGVTRFAPGDKVLAYPGIPCEHCRYCYAGEESICDDFGIFGYRTNGSYAEFTLVKESNLFPLPAGVDFAAAGAFPVTYITAWHAVITRARLTAGETILIHGAGSGVSCAALQIAKLAGGRVIATSGRREKLAKAKDIGADEVIDYHAPDWPEQVRSLTGGRGVEVVFDHIGKATFEGSIAALAKGGRLVTCGATTSPEVKADTRLLYSRQLSLIGSMLGSRGEFMHLLQLLGDGRLHPVIDSSFPLAEAAKAQSRLQVGEQFGKILLQI